MSKQTFKILAEIVSKYTSSGEKKLSNGAWLICPTPQVAPQAWLHILFAPLLNEEIEEIEHNLRILLPKDFKQFLMRTNGLKLFSYSTDVWGLRKSMVRTGEDVWQPHDIIQHNQTPELPFNSPNNVIYFGSTNKGDNWCFFEFDNKTYRVGETDRHRFEPVSYWSNFDMWLLSKLKESESKFNLKGEELIVL